MAKSKAKDFSSIEDFDFGRTPTKVPDEILDREDKVVPKSEEEMEADEIDNEVAEVVTDEQPSEEDYEVVDKMPDEVMISDTEIDDDGDDIIDDINSSQGLVGDVNEEMAEQIIPSINEGLKLLGTMTYDKFVELNDETQRHLEFLEKKMREGKGLSPLEGQTYAGISAIKKAMTDARTLYMNETLPMTPEEKSLSKRALMAYWKSVGKEFSPSSLIWTNIGTMLFKRIAPIATDSMNFGKATV